MGRGLPDGFLVPLKRLMGDTSYPKMATGFHGGLTTILEEISWDLMVILFRQQGYSQQTNGGDIKGVTIYPTICKITIFLKADHITTWPMLDCQMINNE